MAIWRQLVVCCMLMVVVTSINPIESKCEVEGMFIFGDSNVDTGGFWTAFPKQPPPFGMTYFNKSVGRASDGRVIVDFLAQGLGFPFIPPYLKSIGSDFRHGANFASAGTTILIPKTPAGNPFFLNVQLNQLKYFKEKVEQFYTPGSPNLPSPDIFGKSLYIFYIGQNDIGYGMFDVADGKGGLDFYAQMINSFEYIITEIYAMGGRTFMVHGVVPLGCYSSLLSLRNPNATEVDQYGCMPKFNKAVNIYNDMLKVKLQSIREKVPEAKVIYVDTNAMFLKLLQQPQAYGFKYSTKACCGGGGPYNFNWTANCGSSGATTCADPQNYVTFDGIHATEAANKIVTEAILDGSLSDPSFSLSQLCDLKPLS